MGNYKVAADSTSLPVEDIECDGEYNAVDIYLSKYPESFNSSILVNVDGINGINVYTVDKVMQHDAWYRDRKLWTVNGVVVTGETIDDAVWRFVRLQLKLSKNKYFDSCKELFVVRPDGSEEILQIRNALYVTNENRFFLCYFDSNDSVKLLDHVIAE